MLKELTGRSFEIYFERVFNGMLDLYLCLRAPNRRYAVRTQ